VKKDNSAEFRQRIRYLWIHRKGNKTPYAAISDVIDACWKNEDFKPLILKENGKDKEWNYLIHLPPGIGFNEFQKKQQLFADAIGGTVLITKRGTEVLIEALTEELKTNYPFAMFDASKYPKMLLPIPIGFSSKGLIVKDLADFPHLFIAGETNYGKSNLLHVIAVSILLYRPESYVVIIDPKETEFAYLEDHALVVSEADQVYNILKGLNDLMDKRKKQLRSAKCVKVQKYLEKGYEMPLVTLIIDELAELQNDEKLQELLWRLGRMGRFVGIHIIAATQRPSSKLWNTFGEFKAMCHGRVCFIVADEINSRMVLDNDRAAHLPAIKGRAIYKCGLDCLEVQCLLLEPDQAEKLLKNRKGGEVIEVKQSSKSLPSRQSLDLPSGKMQSLNHGTNTGPEILP